MRQAGFSALTQLESLRLADVADLDLLLLHLANAPALRILILERVPVHGDSSRSRPSADALRQLLAAAAQLQVHLPAAVILEHWRSSRRYRRLATSAEERERMDQLFREIQQMAAEVEGVTLVDDEENPPEEPWRR